MGRAEQPFLSGVVTRASSSLSIGARRYPLAGATGGNCGTGRDPGGRHKALPRTNLSTSVERQIPKSARDGRPNNGNGFTPVSLQRPLIIGTNWMNGAATFGSVNRTIMWVQARAVTGLLEDRGVIRRFSSGCVFLA